MNSTMVKLSICRICLTDVAPLCSILNTNLHEIYEVLTKMPFVTEDCSPIQVCELCCASLEHSYMLRRRCLQSEELLTQLLRSNVQVNLQIIFNRHLALGDVIQMTPNECENVEVKHEDNEDERDENSAPPDSVDATATCTFLKKEKEKDNEIPGSEEDPLKIDDNFQSSDSEDISLVVLKKDQSDVTADDAVVERDDTELYHNALGLHTECDIPLDIVKEKPLGDADARDDSGSEDNTETNDITQTEADDVVSSAPVFEKPRLIAQMKYEETPTNKLTRSGTKRAIGDKPVKKNKIVETHDKIVTHNDKQNDSTYDQNYAHKETSENNISADQSLNNSSGNKLKQLLCDICQKCFECKPDLITHIRTHADEKPYKCKVCNKYFSKKGHLGNHMRTHTGQKSYECKVCKRYFSNKGRLDRHTATHTGEKPFQCIVCNKYFSIQFNLDIHMRTHTGEKPYQCNVCKKYFSVKCNLDVHMRTHTGEKPYQCNVCNQCFSDKGSLNKHTSRHTGEKPYKCNICNKHFRLKIILDKHTGIHTGEKPYECNICKKHFRLKNLLDAHTRIHTGEKPYKCNVCNKCFLRKRDLNMHIRTHTGEKPYECNVCKKCLSDEVTLKNHIRTHTGEKPYQCNVCKKCFTRKEYLNYHTYRCEAGY